MEPSKRSPFTLLKPLQYFDNHSNSSLHIDQDARSNQGGVQMESHEEEFGANDEGQHRGLSTETFHDSGHETSFRNRVAESAYASENADVPHSTQYSNLWNALSVTGTASAETCSNDASDNGTVQFADVTVNNSPLNTPETTTTCLTTGCTEIPDKVPVSTDDATSSPSEDAGFRNR